MCEFFSSRHLSVFLAITRDRVPDCVNTFGQHSVGTFGNTSIHVPTNCLTTLHLENCMDTSIPYLSDM